MSNVIYKSAYSKACDIVGRQKPQTQAEEDYCQVCGFEHPEMASEILGKMTGKPFPESNFKWTYKKAIQWIKSL